MRARMVRRLFHRIGVLIVNLLLWARILTDEPESDDEDVERAVRAQPPAVPGAEPGSYVNLDAENAMLRIAGGEKLCLRKERDCNALEPVHVQWSLGKTIDIEAALRCSKTNSKKAS
jgi:hypothetical protein